MGPLRSRPVLTHAPSPPAPVDHAADGLPAELVCKSAWTRGHSNLTSSLARTHSVADRSWSERPCLRNVMSEPRKRSQRPTAPPQWSEASRSRLGDPGSATRVGRDLIERLHQTDGSWVNRDLRCVRPQRAQHRLRHALGTRRTEQPQGMNAVRIVRAVLVHRAI